MLRGAGLRIGTEMDQPREIVSLLKGHGIQVRLVHPEQLAMVSRVYGARAVARVATERSRELREEARFLRWRRSLRDGQQTFVD
jgi:hypothetical protein